MKKQWQTLGNPDPCLINDPSQNFFEFQLIISKHHIIDHYQMKDERRKDINAEIGGEVGGEVSGEVGGEVSGEVKDSITRDVFKTLSILQKNKPMTRKQLQETLNIKSQDYFRKHFLNPSQQLGLIDMTIPDKPRSSKQKYQLTKKGRMVLKQVNTS
ncbi:cell division protein Fic [Candidatus Magnetomorum sp. HK-1]|nr:cell division protein Fic [Candidatus Magnetomorum sp. HK-1]